MRRVTAIFIVPFFVTLAGANAHALYRCDGDRVARADCCCPETQESREPAVGAAVSGACCCSIEAAEAAPAEACAQANGFENVKTFRAPVAVVSPVVSLSVSRLVAHADTRSPAHPNPSTLLALKTSFLL
jgi:hypothetical protein